MTPIASLSEVPRVHTLAVIINCGTRLATTLALVSALKHARVPVLLIDCESDDGSRAHFELLARTYGLAFWWLDWPLRRHGAALDALFAEVPAERVLLIDSDLEIRDDRVIALMTSRLSVDDRAYGAGMLHGPAWLGKDHGLPDDVGYFAPRMWIPLVLLRTSAIGEALLEGASFRQHRAFLEVAGRPLLSRCLAYRYWIPGLRRLRMPGPRHAGEIPPAPAFVEYDTGAALHQRLCARGHTFGAIGSDIFGHDVRHFHGVSRALRPHRLRALGRRLGMSLADNSVAESMVDMEIRNRLADRYGIRFA